MVQRPSDLISCALFLDSLEHLANMFTASEFFFCHSIRVFSVNSITRDSLGQIRNIAGLAKDKFLLCTAFEWNAHIYNDRLVGWSVGSVLFCIFRPSIGYLVSNTMFSLRSVSIQWHELISDGGNIKLWTMWYPPNRTLAILWSAFRQRPTPLPPHRLHYHQHHLVHNIENACRSIWCFRSRLVVHSFCHFIFCRFRFEPTMHVLRRYTHTLTAKRQTPLRTISTARNHARHF